jgi:hypothetical protein
MDEGEVGMGPVSYGRMWFAFILVLAALFTAWFWQAALRAREQANAVAIDTCKTANVQFLDGTVAFSSMRPARDPGGRLTWRRNYVFDYTDDGTSRHQGFVVLLGFSLEAVGLAPGRVH